MQQEQRSGELILREQGLAAPLHPACVQFPGVLGTEAEAAAFEHHYVDVFGGPARAVCEREDGRCESGRNHDVRVDAEAEAGD